MKETYSETIVQINVTLIEGYRDDTTNNEYSIYDQYSANLLSNNDFETWTDGASSAPDDWTFGQDGGGTDGSVARESTEVKVGSYSAKITAGSTSFDTAYLSQDVHAAKGIAYWRGKTVTLAAWVKCSRASIAQITIYDGVSSTYEFHTGGGSWEWVTVTATIDASATSLSAYCVTNGVNGTNQVAYFDGVQFIEKDSCSNILNDYTTNASTSTSWCCDRCGFSYPKTKLQKVGRLELCSKCIDKEQED